MSDSILIFQQIGAYRCHRWHWPKDQNGTSLPLWFFQAMVQDEPSG